MTNQHTPKGKMKAIHFSSPHFRQYFTVGIEDNLGWKTASFWCITISVEQAKVPNQIRIFQLYAENQLIHTDLGYKYLIIYFRDSI